LRHKPVYRNEALVVTFANVVRSEAGPRAVLSESKPINNAAPTESTNLTSGGPDGSAWRDRMARWRARMTNSVSAGLVSLSILEVHCGAPLGREYLSSVLRASMIR